MTSKPIRQALILVGGKGTRLGEMTLTVPKPLSDIDDGVVFLDVLIEQLTRQGFDDIVLLAGHLGHLIRDRYDGRGLVSASLRVLIEPTAQGTAGAMLMARKLLMPRFLMLNGDSFFDIDLRSLVAEAEANDREALLALRVVADASRYGTVELANGRIVRFREKNPAANSPAIVNAGVYVLTRAILDRVGSLPCSIETDVFPALAQEGRLWGYVRDGYFIDIGLPETLEQARSELPVLRQRLAALHDRVGRT